MSYFDDVILNFSLTRQFRLTKIHIGNVSFAQRHSYL